MPNLISKWWVLGAEPNNSKEQHLVDRNRAPPSNSELELSEILLVETRARTAANRTKRGLNLMCLRQRQVRSCREGMKPDKIQYIMGRI